MANGLSRQTGMPPWLRVRFRKADMAEDLMTYLNGRESTVFEPHPFYSADGDFLTFYFREDDHYAERVDELLTVYLSIDTQELVGCKIKGVRRILDACSNS